MKRFNTVEDVKKAFLSRSAGADTLKAHIGFRCGDIDKYAPIVEKLLDTDYNQVSGFTFPEIAEAISTIQSNYGSSDYVNEYRNAGNSVNESALVNNRTEFFNEAFEGTTVAQAPYPVPSLNLTLWAYEKSVLPFLAHLFDLKGNRGLVYYQKITATNSKGNISAGDLLGSPKDMSAQPVGFIGTKVINEEIGTGDGSETDFTKTLANVPIQPGSLVITIAGETGYFMDIAQEASMTGATNLLSVNGNLGTGTINTATGALTLTLTTAPASGAKIYATYNRDVETTTGGTNNQARLTVSLESKHLDAENFSVYTDTNLYQEALSKAIFGLDWNAEVDNALGMLWNKEVANKIVSEIKAAIPAGSVATHDMAAFMSTGSGNNPLFSVQFVSVVLGKIRQLIAQASGIAVTAASSIVIAPTILPILEGLSKFKKATNGFEDTMGGMALVGLYDGIPVVLGYEPIMETAIASGATSGDDGELVGIYKSKAKDFLTPYVFGTFIQPVIRDVFDQNNLAINKKQLIASAAGEVVAEKLAAKINLTGISDII